jgi:predicted dehydrogenase
MNQHDAENGGTEFNRRDFIKGASFGTLMMMMGGIPLQAADTNAQPKDTGFVSVEPPDPVSCGVIGCGVWGREILKTLAVLPHAPVVAICDTYGPWLNRAKNEAAPKAETYKDYKELLANKSVQAVIIATPTPTHKEIVLAALAAGKHVYCEAPLGGTIEDARAIAQAAKAAAKVNFQAGLQNRSDPNRVYVRGFIRSGALGKNVMLRSQWNKKESWRRTAPSPEREQALNWRLQKATSTGLAGELGIHQLDIMNWFTGELPVAATGYGGILSWNDGRDVADTVQSVIQYAGDVNYTFAATIASNFDSDYEMMYGTYATVMMRGNKAWMFKEADSPQLGWEVYARKDLFYQETGIALSMDATKLVALQNKTTNEVSYEDSPLHFSLKAFVTNSYYIGNGVQNFIDTNGADAEGLPEFLATVTAKYHKPAAGYLEGFEATVTAIKINEAIVKGEKIALSKDMFQL